MFFTKTTQLGMCNTQAGARPLRKAIRKNQQPQRRYRIRPMAVIKPLLLLSFAALTGLGGVKTLHYISGLKAQRDMLRLQLQEHLQIQVENAAKVAFFESALHKTLLTPYCPQMGGINGNGRVYANGEPVIPIAASRKALKTGSVAMGDYVLLVGQIKDTKGPSIRDHSFDVQVPDAHVAKVIGKRPYAFVNLSAKRSPYRHLATK